MKIKGRRQVLLPWKQRFPGRQTTLPLRVLLLSPNSHFPPHAEPSLRNTIQAFSCSDINVTAHIPKSNTTIFESSGQSALTLGCGLVKFNSWHKYTDH